MIYSRSASAIRACVALLCSLLVAGRVRAQSVPVAPSAEQQKAQSEYAEMLARVQQGDMSIDFRAFRWAGAQKSGPHASMIEMRESNAFEKLAAAGDCAGALASAQKALERNYASPLAHIDAMRACQSPKQTDEAALHGKMLDALLDSIRQSGDGKSAETAYFVVTGQEEYIFLNRVLHLQGRSQSLVRKGGHFYDRLLAVDPATNQTQDVWFNADFDSSDAVTRVANNDGVLAMATVIPPNAAPETPRQEPPSAPAQVAPTGDPIAILNQTASIYGGASSLQLTGVKIYERHDEFVNNVTRTPFTLILTPDNKFRQESKNEAGTDLQVCDGQRNWHYLARTKKYFSAPGAPDPVNLFNSRIDLRFLNEHLITAELLRQERLQTDTGEHLCDVIQAHYERAQQPSNLNFGDVLFWIDRSSRLVWKTRTEVVSQMPQSGAKMAGFETTLYSDVPMNLNLQAAAFAFVPPPGATEQNAGKVDGREALVGRPAPDFTLRDLEGEQIQLSGLRGKVVLLDFWATWCGPCRMTMPKLNNLVKKFRKQDVVILGIDVSEEEQTVRTFLRKNRLEYPILLVPRGNPVVENYSARSIPALVVIDRNGLVAEYKVGYGNETEEMLRADIARLLSVDYVAPKPTAAAGAVANAPVENWREPKTAADTHPQRFHLRERTLGSGGVVYSLDGVYVVQPHEVTVTIYGGRVVADRAVVLHYLRVGVCGYADGHRVDTYAPDISLKETSLATGGSYSLVARTISIPFAKTPPAMNCLCSVLSGSAGDSVAEALGSVDFSLGLGRARVGAKSSLKNMAEGFEQGL